MKRLCVVAVVLATVSGVGAAVQFRPSILPHKKGMIQNIWVEPTVPTASTPVMLCVSVADPLRVQKMELRRLSHRFVLSVYWIDPPTGTTEGSSLGQCAQPLGTMHAAGYGVAVQSFYKGMLVDFRTMMFQVH